MIALPVQGNFGKSFFRKCSSFFAAQENSLEELRGFETFRRGSDVRTVQYYIPNVSKKDLVVVFMADGQALDYFVDQIIKHNLPVALFGLESLADIRRDEYLGTPGDLIFDQHEKWFKNSMLAMADEKLKMNLNRKQRFLLGFSNGGSFVYDLALRNSDLFAGVIALSIARKRAFVPYQKIQNPVRAFLAAGSEGYEVRFATNTQNNVYPMMVNLGVVAVFQSYPRSDHDLGLWTDAFVEGLYFLLSPTTK